jgi:hypothetical protein
MAATSVKDAGTPQPNQRAFFILKALNLILITTYSFELVYVLVRVLSLKFYSIAVFISSLGVYVMATDLGYSGFVYSRIRQSFLRPGEPHESLAEAFVIYVAIALVSAAAVAVGIEFVVNVPFGVRIALSLYFLSIVIALPWGLIRKIAAAVDLYLQFEIIEFVRRLFFMIVAALMLAGLPFSSFSAICLLAWSVAVAYAIRMLYKRRGIALIKTSSAKILQHVLANYGNLWRSGSLTLIEFVIWTFPYIVIPILFTEKTFIVAFDVFFKVVRFGATSYSVPAETFLPPQTRAFYLRNWKGVARYYVLVLLIGAVSLFVAVGVLLGFGDRIFAVLLSHGDIIDKSMRISMAAMLAAVLFQAAAGCFLVGTGHYAQPTRLASVTLTIMASVVVSTWGLQLSFSSFMKLYVLVYFVHALFYTALLFRLLGSLGRLDALDARESGRTVPGIESR